MIPTVVQKCILYLIICTHVVAMVTGIYWLIFLYFYCMGLEHFSLACTLNLGLQASELTKIT